MKCKYCQSPDVKPWWPSADTDAYVCTNPDCTEKEYKRTGGRVLQYLNKDGELDD